MVIVSPIFPSYLSTELEGNSTFHQKAPKKKSEIDFKEELFSSMRDLGSEDPAGDLQTYQLSRKETSI